MIEFKVTLDKLPQAMTAEQTREWLQTQVAFALGKLKESVKVEWTTL